MRVQMIAAEATPYVKVGGLADVVGALPGDLAALGCQVDLILPGYRRIADQALGFHYLGQIGFTYAGKEVHVHLHRLYREDGVTVTVIDEPLAFDRDGVYDDPMTKEGYKDNPERFAFFSRAVAELVIHDHPDVVHVHDSHAALVPALLKIVLPHRIARRVATVLTIHNLAYQMTCRPDVLFDVGFPRELFFPMSPLEYYGVGNFLKTGICYADAVTTVSERYAHEIRTPEMGCGLDGVLRVRDGDLLGILNGIDTSVWNPRTDPLLPARYSADDLAGKAKCREELLRAAGLDAASKAPVIGMVGRLADQKGLDIFADAAGHLANMGVRFAILGAGQEKYHRMLGELQRWRPDRFSIYLGFNDELAHRIEAGSDFFLMPSRFEPCGLNQMYSMRYGTVPIVRRTGGLADTVQDYDESHGEGTGFAFDAPHANALLSKVHSALQLYENEDEHRRVMLRGMSQDFSVRRSAERYKALYESLRR